MINTKFINGDILYAQDMNTIVYAINELDKQIEPLKGKLQEVSKKLEWSSFN